MFLNRVNGTPRVILITVENSHRVAVMVGRDCKLRFYPRELTALKGII